MIIESLVVVWSLGMQNSAAAGSGCGQALAAGRTGMAADICLAEEQVRLAERAPKGSPERRRFLEAAIDDYRHAMTQTKKIDEKARALDAITRLYDASHMNDPVQMDRTLRELIALQPDELEPVFRLARLLEDGGLTEAAEEMLLAARRQKPEMIDPYRMLAQFYARRATAMHQLTETQKAAPPTSGPGEPDANGVYRVGGSTPPPARLETPRYPPEAQAAGIQGVVIAEVVISETGIVTDARVVRSIPLLDDAALAAVRTWRFAPSIVNGQAVPVRMTVTVNFTQR